MGFVFSTKGAALMYRFLRTHPGLLDESWEKTFTNFASEIESGDVTISRLPKEDDRLFNKTLRERSTKIQTNRVNVMLTCLGMCEIAYKLELFRKTNGNYPETLIDSSIFTPVPVDCWGEPYVYQRDGNSYKMYSKGIDKADNGGETSSISVLVTTEQGDINLEKAK